MTEKPQEGSRVVRGIPTVPKPSKKELNEKQQLDYHHHRRDLLKWCFQLGKNPEKADGYANATVRVRAGHIDRFYRWVWMKKDGYTTQVTHADADSYMEHLAFERDDIGVEAKDKYQKALKMLFKWRSYRHGDDEWEPTVNFGTGDTTTNPREYFRKDERRQLREASLELGTIPHYKSVTSEERERWKKWLAIRLAKPINEITRDDWKEVRGWKEPSLIHTGLDAGLRPIEVERATVDWVDAENNCLRIPKEESSKNRDHWVVALRSQTTEILQNWMSERANYEKYDDTNKLWLTRRRNPYSSSSLSGLIDRVCEEAEINTETRDISWYAIRHSTGTYMSHEAGLAAAQSQLRHKSSQTTMKYDQTPPEDRRDALDKMG